MSFLRVFSDILEHRDESVQVTSLGILPGSGAAALACMYLHLLTPGSRAVCELWGRGDGFWLLFINLCRRRQHPPLAKSLMRLVSLSSKAKLRYGKVDRETERDRERQRETERDRQTDRQTDR